MKNHRQFILDNTAIQYPPHVPEIALHLADEVHELWHKTEEELQKIGLEPPFWAFAWAGGQGLARHILDNPDLVCGRKVLDLATGSGLVAIAAMKAGAKSVIANDIDPVCETALAINSQINGVETAFSEEDLLANYPPDWLDETEVILAGDVFYDAAFAKRAHEFLCRQSKSGKAVLVGDPGRAYLPQESLTLLAEYQVPVSRMLEDSEVKRTRVWEIQVSAK